MSVTVAAIASGSNGNCYYVSNGREAILVDVGISCRELTRRMERLHILPSFIQAVFISHEHSDHICGLEAVQRKYQWPVYINRPTLANSRLQLEPGVVRYFTPGETVAVGTLLVHTFTKRHDAAQPCSFVVQQGLTNVGIMTDIGQPCNEVVDQFARCQAVFLESNYCEKMLWEGRYPAHLKRRIHGSYGHLSNDQALQLFLGHRHPQLSHLVLSHLSQNNNHPDVVERLFAPYHQQLEIIVASRHHETALHHITKAAEPVPPVYAQMGLFW